MRNRAKCKLCNDIIESLGANQWVKCKCGEVSINGGPFKYEVSVGDYANMLRVDDDGNEVAIKVKQAEGQDSKEDTFGLKPSRDELLGMLLEQINNSENLPMHVRSSFVTYLELESALLLIYAILKEPRG